MGAMDDELDGTAERNRKAFEAEARFAEVRRDRDSARQALSEATAEVEALRARLGLVERIVDLDPNPPKWLTPKRKTTAHHATLTTILSDLHLDETVLPEEVNGVNAYSREIATIRLKRWADRTVMMARQYMSGVTFDSAVVMLGGDLVAGELRQEDLITNEDTVLGTMLYWSEMLAAAIGQIADEFGRVYVPVVCGNHGRRTAKPRMKGRARDNFDWMLGHLVAREFRGDDRVVFDIPDGAHVRFEVYGTTYWLEHGDAGGSGGNGWMGVLGPAMKKDQRKRKQTQAMGLGYDHFVIGHYHTLSWLPGATVNGSMVGFSEYPWLEGMGYEDPQQAMWLTTPERGITLQAPVMLLDRKAEGW